MRGLAVRVLLFLSLALLPIGLIAVVQTRQIAEQSKVSAELSLLAVTEQASSAERQIIQEAFGAAEALSPMVRLWRRDSEGCSDFLREYMLATNLYSMVGFVEADGKMNCSSQLRPYDFSQSDAFKALQEEPWRRATSTQFGGISKQPVIFINTPVYEKGDLIGYMAISIPHATFEQIEETPHSLTPLAMVTLNQHGDILTTERGLEIADPEYPADVALSLFVGQDAQVFEAKNSLGDRRAYAVLPIVPKAVYAMSVWPADTPLLQSGVSARLSTLLPIAMWLASLIVAFWALNRLAITHIRKLGRQMRRFALNRTLPRGTLGAGVPTELVEMETSFIGMAESILRDEATLEDGLRQQNILLKEVHHRVKNNLQLISSIMNMQIRQAKTEDARRVLKRLQERILSLATVHKSLYQNDNLVRVDAGILLKEIVEQLLSVGLVSSSQIKVAQSYESISLDADDAAPLTLLVSEAMTNALKYLSTITKGDAHISICFEHDGPENAKLVVSNTIGTTENDAGTGLGSRLILAFTRQLNGQVQVKEEDDVYEVTVTFPVPIHDKEVYDY
ncbi:sensor histidine kinase [Sulfitobacter aestuarii]|uniref:histidine kinase n=1 Tax=Sulfitobacter aestuarii TaxID=2161676 RepID=A0ABW5U6S3_9RHOB